LESLAGLCFALWPESSREEHACELAALLEERVTLLMPLVHFVAENGDGRLVGFLEAGLRSHADCCDASHAVGYVEGWYVEESYRRQGIGRQLMAIAERWARERGCVEMASDSLIENELSQRAHAALGYQVVARSVLCRKLL
jgi:aminoglycoside 6'-N-acetyltransferase I